MGKFKSGFVAAGAALWGWLGILAIPALLMVISNVIDYITGVVAAPYRQQDIKSYKSIRGIAKKVCMWLLVGVGMILDRVIRYAGGIAGLDLPFDFVVASVVAMWIIANEIISILENISDIGVDMPPFLLKIAKKLKSETEKKGDEKID
jgi:toxin secretion/phage lysis holin